MGGKTPEWMPELFFCHRYEFCVIADQLGFHLGTRTDQFDTNSTQRLLDEGFAVDFVDNNFKDPDRDRLYDIVEETQCNYVVLPDIYDLDDVDSVISFGKELLTTFDVKPIVVPKVTFDYSRIPSEWIIGFSVPSGYGETEIPITAFTDHRVHLLGGSHKNQLTYAKRAVENGVTVFSVDGNAFTKASSYGHIVNGAKEILSEDGSVIGNAWNADVDGYTDWGQRIAQSLARYYELWRLWSLRVDAVPTTDI